MEKFLYNIIYDTTKKQKYFYGSDAINSVSLYTEYQEQENRKMKMTQDEKYMKAAIREAKKAYALDEVPIGCVIVQDGTIIARGYNRRNTEGNTLAHAELTAIKKASKKTGDWAVRGLYDVCDIGAMLSLWKNTTMYGSIDRSRDQEK